MFRLPALLSALCLLLAGCVSARPAEPEIRSASISIPDERRGSIPVSLLWPERGAAPLLLFSHGAFSSPDKYRALLQPLAEAGFLVAAPLHADSEAWEGARPQRQEDGLAWRIADLRRLAASEDMIEDATGIRPGGPLAAAGHSFGALAAQVLGGARPGAAAGAVPADPPVDVAAVLAISPPGPIPEYIDAAGWSEVSAPQLVVTGTADVVPPLVTDWRQHLASYEAASAPAYLFVAEGGDHYFGNIIGRTEYAGPPQSEPFAKAVEHSVDFLQAYVLRDDAALARLQSSAAVTSRNQISGETE